MSKKIWEIDSFDEFKNDNKDFFIKHKATLEKLKGNDGRDCIIKFERDNTTDGAMMFTYINGVLSISGDYGNVMFNWYNKNNHILAYGTFDSFGYILSKIVASENYKEFDMDLADKEIREYMKEYSEQLKSDGNSCEKLDELIEEFEYNNLEMDFEYKNWVSENSEILSINENESYHLYTAGEYTKERPYIWWYGLQSALEQLEKQGAFK